MPITLGTNEAVRDSALCRRTFEHLISAGKLKSVKVGRRRLILESSLRELLMRGVPAIKKGAKLSGG